MSKKLILIKILIILLVIYAGVHRSNGQSFGELNSNIRGTLYKSLEINSNIINNKLEYSIYLPPYYHTTTDSFPVLYLLHGIKGDETSWIDRCEIHIIIDSLIKTEEIPPLIVVMPDARNSYYMNDYLLQFPYEDILIREFIPYIDSTYKTLPDYRYRIIGGLSMGGFGAIINSIKHADVFGSCIALSAAVRTDEMIINLNSEDYNSKFSGLYGSNLEGNERINQHWENNSPFYLINDSTSDKLKGINWYFDCGMSDFLINGNELLHQIFLKYSIPHEYHVRIGTHNWDYWLTGIIGGIKFAGQRISSF
jgi:enterochelin esterase-like enzyme